MAMPMNLDAATASNMEANVANAVIAPKITDAATGQDETVWQDTEGSKWLGYFYASDELKSALLMKGIWVVGKGYTCDPATKTTTDHISGFGKDSFLDILFNMEVTKRIYGDAYAEIIRDETSKTIINLKPLDPMTMQIVVNSGGILTAYRQVSKTKGGATKEFTPDQIFHLVHNRIADQIHGISDIKILEKTVLAEIENFEDMKKIMHRQAKPMIMFKLGTDTPAKIATFIAKMDGATNKGENIYIPDDQNTVSYEVVQVNVSQIIMEWRNDIKNKFYRALGIPLILFGAQGSTESGGKIEYTGHEQIWEKDQLFLEEQVWNQLYLKIKLNRPTSLLGGLQQDQSKDGAMAQMGVQPNDMQAGKGK